MKKKILLTRPRAASERWAALLAAHGFDSVIEPLLIIEPTQELRPTGHFQAIILTSANAPDALDAMRDSINDLLTLPCFCVGVSTAAVARAIGFTNIIAGLSDGATLARKIITSLEDKSRPLLHIAGDKVEGRMHDILVEQGFVLTSWIVYRAHAVDDLSASLRAAFAAGEFAAVPVFSPRSARILVSLIEKSHLSQACSKTIAVGLSQAVADMLQTLPWRHLRVAATPLEEDVLTCLELSMTQSDTTTPPSPPQPMRKKSGSSLLSFLSIVLLAIVGVGVALGPWLHPPLPAAPSASEGKDIERRLETLENRVQTLTEIPTPTPQGTSDVSGLSEQIKSLQTQVALLASKDTQGQQTSQKLVTTFLAFVDLRDVAHNGQSFTAQLDTLRAAVNGDAAFVEQIAALEPYAGHPIPTLPQLRDLLMKEESKLDLPTPPSETSSLSGRLKTIFRPLISVRPLHDPQFNSLEQALSSGDAEAALDASKALPADTQRALSAWQEQLVARLAIETNLRAIAAHLTEAPMQGTTP